ncbi:MAG: hypothetical protein U1F50_08335 [Rubrivivax sp.]
MSHPPPEPTQPGAPAGPWARFAAKHLFDYTPAARRVWFGLVAAGLLAGAWAAVRVAGEANLGATAFGVLLVVLAALFTLQVPRSAFSVSVADVFIFGILAALGPACAVLAAGFEGLVGTLRTSRRLSSRISTPTTAMASMAVTGAAFEGLRRLAARPAGTRTWSTWRR